MRRAWAILAGILLVASACSDGGHGIPTSTSTGSIAADAKPKRKISLSCTSGTTASVHVELLDGGIFSTNVVASGDVSSCGGSALLTGAGKADAFTASYAITAPPGGGGCFTTAVLPGKGATDTCVAASGGGTATLTIK
jgi:hypothetical protein